MEGAAIEEAMEEHIGGGVGLPKLKIVKKVNFDENLMKNRFRSVISNQILMKICVFRLYGIVAIPVRDRHHIFFRPRNSDPARVRFRPLGSDQVSTLWFSDCAVSGVNGYFDEPRERDCSRCEDLRLHAVRDVAVGE